MLVLPSFNFFFSQCFAYISLSIIILLIYRFTLLLLSLTDNWTFAKVGIKPSLLYVLMNFVPKLTFWNFVLSVSNHLTMLLQ